MGLLGWQYTYTSHTAWGGVIVVVALLTFVALVLLAVWRVRRRRTRPLSRRAWIVLAIGVIGASAAGLGPASVHRTAPVATGAAQPLRDRFTRDTGIWHVGPDGATDIEYDHGRLAVAVDAADLSVLTRRQVGRAAGLTIEIQVGGGKLAQGDVVGVLCGEEFKNPSHLDEYALTLTVGDRGPAGISFSSYTPFGPATGNAVAIRKVAPISADGPITLRAECAGGKGDAAKLWINGKLAVSGGVSPGFDGYNSVGLYTYSLHGGTRALFDNLVVTPKT